MPPVFFMFTPVPWIVVTGVNAFGPYWKKPGFGGAETAVTAAGVCRKNVMSGRLCAISRLPAASSARAVTVNVERLSNSTDDASIDQLYVEPL